MENPYDPASSAKAENGHIIELNDKSRAKFNMIGRFIADYAINVAGAKRAMQLDALEIVRMLVDTRVNREETIAITAAVTPAKAVEVMAQMSMVEMMMALQKVRARRTPSNQCHVANLKDNPAQITADAAETGIHGFSEQGTMVGIACYAPFDVLTLLVGSQCGRPDVLTQCSVEKATELELDVRGLTSYAKMVSMYGAESVFIGGDDAPWSKAFLTSAYASRGLKMRYIPGTGSEALMGYSEDKSMLYLELRCILITKGAGVQRLQSDAVNCIGMTSAIPSGIRAVLAENLIVSVFGLEMASVNDQTFSHSDIRRTAHTLMQMLPGTDFIFSGYNAVPSYSDMFAGSNLDAKDFDDCDILQRDLTADDGLRPATEKGAITIRNKAARATQAIFRRLSLPLISDREVETAAYAHGNKDMPVCSMIEDLAAVEEMMRRNITGLGIIGMLSCSGFEDTASDILNMLRQRVTGSYLQTSAILDRQFDVVDAVNGINDYQGPGTGYHISAERWTEVKNIAGVAQPGSVE